MSISDNDTRLYGSERVDTGQSAGDGRRWITTVLIILGAGTLVFGMGNGAWSAGASGFLSTQQTLTVAAIQAGDTIRVDVERAQFTLEYGDVSEPVLTAEGTSQWTMKRNGDEVVVSSSYPRLPFIGWNSRSSSRVVLTLPNILNRGTLNLDLAVGAGQALIDGNFNEIDLQVGAGEATIDGAMRDLNVTLGVGDVTVRGTDVRTADLEVSVGTLAATFEGSTPQDLSIVLSLGDATITVPVDRYAVSSQGSVTNSLMVDSTSANRIKATASLGDIMLKSSRD